MTLEEFSRLADRKQRQELAVVRERARAVMAPRAVTRWLTQPVPSLNQDTPIERIARGDVASVLGIISRLENDGFA